MTNQKNKRFISFSGGVESTTMCLIYGGKANAIFSDTGFEHAELYDWIEKVESRIQQVHPDFKVIRIAADMTLPAYIKKHKFFPSPMARYCTRIFKIEPIDKFLKEQGECELFIGLNAEETNRTGNHGLISTVNYRYPLIENGLTRAACIELLKKADLMPNFPPYMSRGGCVGCFFKSRAEYEAMALLSPDEAYAVADLEDIVQDERGTRYGVRDGIPNMRKFIDWVRAQELLFPLDEIYNNTNQKHTPCGVFCHR